MECRLQSIRRQHPEIDRYLREVPSSLWDILLDGLEEDPEQFARSIKELRLKEEERNYVLAIQRHYSLMPRPQESVKGAMIRARLAVMNRRKAAGRNPDSGNLPTDPLE